MTLPAHRRIDAGRTWPSPYSPAKYGTAIERHVPRAERIGGVVLALILGITGAALLVHALAS
jgi:hypothetical protein